MCGHLGKTSGKKVNKINKYWTCSKSPYTETEIQKEEQITKILKNNYKGKVPQKKVQLTRDDYKIACQKCKSEIEYAANDIQYPDDVNSVVVCPCCGAEIPVCEKDVTIENLVFPNDFYSFEDGVKISDKKIKDFIQEGVDYLRSSESQDDFFWYSGTGDTHVLVHRLDGDESYNVVVSRGYYELDLQYDDADYDAYGFSRGDEINGDYSDYDRTSAMTYSRSYV